MILVPVIGAGAAGQALKSLAEALTRRQRSLSRIADVESFPNLHAVLAGGLSFQVGEETGLRSPILAVTITLSLVLLYDTSGVKRAAGKQAWVLNRLHKASEGAKPLFEIPGQSPLRTWAAALFGAMASFALERGLLALSMGL